MYILISFLNLNKQLSKLIPATKLQLKEKSRLAFPLPVPQTTPLAKGGGNDGAFG